MLSFLRKKFGLRRYLRQFKSFKAKRNTQETKPESPADSTLNKNTSPRPASLSQGCQICPKHLDRIRRQHARSWVRRQEAELQCRRNVRRETWPGAYLPSFKVPEAGSLRLVRRQSHRCGNGRVSVSRRLSVVSRGSGERRCIDEGSWLRASRDKKEEKKDEAGEGKQEGKTEDKTVEQEKNNADDPEKDETIEINEQEGNNETTDSSGHDINSRPGTVEGTNNNDARSERSDHNAVLAQEVLLSQCASPVKDHVPTLDPLPAFDPLPTFNFLSTRNLRTRQDPLSAQPIVQDRLTSEYVGLPKEEEDKPAATNQKDDPEGLQNRDECDKLGAQEEREDKQGAWEDMAEDDEFGATLTRQTYPKSTNRPTVDQPAPTVHITRNEDSAERAWGDEAEYKEFGMTLARHSIRQGTDDSPVNHPVQTIAGPPAGEHAEEAWEDEAENGNPHELPTMDSDDPVMVDLALDQALRAHLANPRPKILPTTFNARPDTNKLSPFDSETVLNLNPEYLCGLRHVHFRHWSADIKAKTVEFWSRVEPEKLSAEMEMDINENIDRLASRGLLVMKVSGNAGDASPMQRIVGLPEASNSSTSTKGEDGNSFAQITSLYGLTAEFQSAGLAWASTSPATEIRTENATEQKEKIDETAPANDSDVTLQGSFSLRSPSPDTPSTLGHCSRLSVHNRLQILGSTKSEDSRAPPVLVRFPVLRRRPEQIGGDSAQLLPRRTVLQAPTRVSAVEAEGRKQLMQMRTVQKG